MQQLRPRVRIRVQGRREPVLGPHQAAGPLDTPYDTDAEPHERPPQRTPLGVDARRPLRRHLQLSVKVAGYDCRKQLVLVGGLPAAGDVTDMDLGRKLREDLLLRAAPFVARYELARRLCCVSAAPLNRIP